MILLWNYLKPHRWLVLLSLLLAGIAQLLTLVDPLIFGKIVDEYAMRVGQVPDEELVEGALWLLLLAVGVALLARAAKAFQEYVVRLVVQRFGMQIFNDGIRQTLRLSYQEFADQRSGETLSILQKVRTDTERFINSFINILFSSLVGIGFLVWYAITTHWALVPVFVIGILVLGGGTGLLSRHIKGLQRSINRETYKMSGVITESLRNIELVKSLGLTFQEIRRLRAHTEAIFELEMQKVRRVRTLSFLQGTALGLLKQSILFILLWLIFRQVLSPGELIAMQFITAAIFVPLQDMGNIILHYREADASLRTFDALMQKPIEKRPEEPTEIGPLQQLQFKEVVFRHKGAGYNALDGISFTARSGQTLAFVGPSGSGKSTLVKLLVGLYTPLSGSILYNGVPAREIRMNPLRRQFGFVTQDTNLFSGSLRDNLLFVKPDATDADMQQALEQASAEGILKRSDKGLDTHIGEGGMKLSGGEKQRISIARSLIRNPQLLIFDEATSALDSLTEEEITETVKQLSLSGERITILIAHRLSTILHADTIFVLERGKIVETGAHEELVARGGLYYAMWRQQIGER
ncbi:ABC transporter ATP-binding protein [Cesiribacter andamanensis]|uniref:Putative multidrug resistance ABC transporter ATP-binding/permease protein YheI n=1 Tax=Cesiribacter andamanensis AMV16 TaxID=1279009 RepID=M7N3Y9_9BACT|nr:ABC transporter ATP-binding protein [Cesiribacter andamanensis]EMR01931.1 putative multidrug resistance ABC transporter ATP-binding/permease protein YheI [Cesiribacter andamanensis AMV16]